MPHYALHKNPYGMVVVDGEILLDFITASKKLHSLVLEGLAFQEDGVRQASHALEQWEIAHTTLAGNVRPA